MLQWKEIQKQKRLEMIENKQDPYEPYEPYEPYKKKCVKKVCEKEKEEYMIPFVFDL